MKAHPSRLVFALLVFLAATTSISVLAGSSESVEAKPVASVATNSPTDHSPGLAEKSVPSAESLTATGEVDWLRQETNPNFSGVWSSCGSCSDSPCQGQVKDAVCGFDPLTYQTWYCRITERCVPGQPSSGWTCFCQADNI